MLCHSLFHPTRCNYELLKPRKDDKLKLCFNVKMTFNFRYNLCH